MGARTIKISFFITLLLECSCCLAQDKHLVINEIAWMGTQDGYTKEWIEIYNPTENTINLDGWWLIDKYGKINVKLKGEIAPFSFFLLERTSDDTLPEVKANLIYKGTLKNSGGHLVLLNPSNKIIDEVNCENGWFAGDNKTKRTMERINPYLSGSNAQNWQTSIYPGGTPKNKNYVLVKKEEEAKKDLIGQKERISNSFPLKFLLASIGSFSLTFFILKTKLKERQ